MGRNQAQQGRVRPAGQRDRPGGQVPGRLRGFSGPSPLALGIQAPRSHNSAGAMEDQPSDSKRPQAGVPMPCVKMDCLALHQDSTVSELSLNLWRSPRQKRKRLR